MRNLFSFLGGLLSGALYLFVNLVLALDRLICFFLDLPIWQLIRKSFENLSKKRSICAALAFVPLFCIPASCLFQSGEMVSVNSKPLGLIAEASMLKEVIEEIETSVSDFQGNDYTIPLSISYKDSLGTQAQFLDKDQLKNELIAAIPDVDTLAVISVDGERAGVCRTAEDAQILLDRIKAQYITATDDNAEFMQSVRIDTTIASTDFVSDFGSLYNELAPKLDVTSTRSVTYTEEIPFETITQENSGLDQTHRETLQSGSSGEAVVTAEITTVDGQEHGRTIVQRTVLSEATNEVIEIGTKNIGIGTGVFEIPLTSYTFTSGYKWRWGKLHSGVDLAVPEGNSVYASDNGKVIVAENSGNGYGNYIIIDHQNGYKTLYGHNSELCVAVGDIVAKGDKIALSGNTGNSTGPHVHFEIHVNDEKVDPQQYISL